MADEAVLGFGAKAWLHNGTTLTELDGVLAVSPPNLEIETVDSTHHGSSGGIRTFIPGLGDPGEISFRIFYSPGSATDTLLIAAVAARTTRAFKVAVPETDGTLQEVTGTCIPTSYAKDDVVIDDKMTAVFKGKVTGAYSQAAGT
jgi:hypothetical protein